MTALTEYLTENKIEFTVSADGHITVTGNLDFPDTDTIPELPENLTVGGSLNLCFTKITTLPENLTVGGNLYLWRTQITTLPENLTVGGDLYLSYTQITTLPDTLKVHGKIRGFKNHANS